jgi:hypothetical protein
METSEGMSKQAAVFEKEKFRVLNTAEIKC